jgi:NSS family neurotransmitter:Na+ symporter
MAERETFSSRWSLLLSALGMVIGTGNIWRFPRIVAKNGGGAFLIAWMLFLFLWSIPLLLGEFAIGKHTRYGTIGSFAKLIGKKFAWMGGFVGLCATAIMFYYSVVMGWCLRFLFASITGELAAINQASFWGNFTQTAWQPVLFHAIAITACSLIVLRGVSGGIEKINKVLIPSLIAILIIAVVRAVTLPGGLRGLNYLFKPEWHVLLGHKVWLEALSQSAWSTGAGWGLLLTYAVYLKQKEDVVLNTFIAGLGNNSASLLVGIAIFPSVFALAPMLNANPTELLALSGPASTGMAFIWMPRLFAHMPGSGIFTFLFFLSLTIAAATSLVAMIELAARNLMDLGMKRKSSVATVWIVAFLLGVPSAASISFFENQDWVWGIGLIVSGAFIAFAIIKYDSQKFLDCLLNDEFNDIRVGGWFRIVINYVIPVEFVFLLGWWFYQAIAYYEPTGWWNPFRTFSVSTCLVQWGIVILLFMLLNSKITKRLSSLSPEIENGA